MVTILEKRLLETGDTRLLETGGDLLLEISPSDLNGYRLLEDGSYRLLETGERRLLEGFLSGSPFLIGFGISGNIGKVGDPDPLNVNGIYQMRMTKKGKVPIKMKFYTPANPETIPQQANRQKFADAMTAWGNLTDEQKTVYNKRAKKRQMFGWGLFIREYYQAN